MKKFNKNLIVAVMAILAVSFAFGLIGPIATQAFVSPAAVTLGTAANFVILAETGITNTGSHATRITGNIGNSPGASSQMNGVFCSGPDEINGTIYGVDATYVGSGDQSCFAGAAGDKTTVDTAVNDMTVTAYTDAAARLPDETGRAAGSIGGETFTTGVYKWNSDVDLATDITLSGSATDVWIFQMTGNLSLASKGSIALGVKVLLTGGAKASNAYWQVGGGTGATLGTYSTFNGTILSATQVILQTGAILNGRALAQSLVTLDANTISLSTTQLTVTKTVTNNNGGVKVVANFPLFIDGMSVTSGVASTTSIGAHIVSETTDAGYSSVIGGDCSDTGTITLASGDNKTCTIINNDIGPQLTVTKTVINDNGGVKTIANFPLFIDNMSVTSGVASTTSIGAHIVSETTDAGYTSVIGGDCAADGAVTLALGQTKTCTITNNDIAGGQLRSTINVVKTVINDSGGTKVVSDFPLFINGAPVISGTSNALPSNITYTVTETADAGYTQAFSGDCDSSGRVNLIPGGNRVCIITNNDIGSPAVVPPVPPLIDVVKIASPLALPNGPGAVAYTYTLSNTGTVPVTDITMVGDTCSPIALASGDTNTNAKLEVSETWVYRCSTTLAETHTNTVVATGWANGISAVDIASATVIVGAPVVPPLIHVTKIPSPLALIAGGGMVTYTKKVTNPGTVALSNVRVTDDKCAAVKYISGDTDKDSKLDTTEAWVYTCRANLTKTTTNTAVATGEANGLIARDFAIATVVVAAVVPKLPKTGLASAEESVSWNIVLLAGLLIVSSASLAVVLRKRKI